MLRLAAGSHLRFEDSANGTVTGRHYGLHSGDEVLLECDTEGQCIKRPTEFRRPGTPSPEFTLRATRKVLNFTYHVQEGPDGPRLGTLDCKGTGALWKIRDADEALVGRIVDPTKWTTDLVRTALSGSPETYCLLFGDELCARIERIRRPRKNSARGPLGKFFQNLLTLWDWSLQVEKDLEGGRAALAVAGTLLLIEHQIRNSHSQ